MNNVVEFLTSKEIIIVYIVSGLACLICFIGYLIEKNSEKSKRKHNTRELNKLVKEVQEQLPLSDPEVIRETPVLKSIKNDEVSSVTELLESTGKIKPIVSEDVEIKPYVVEPTPEKTSIMELDNEIISKTEELEYTDIEPDQETAKKELKKLEEKLLKEEANNNIKLTNYEEEQEASAIISVDELVKKGKELYEANEKTQYQDEGNEPISIQDLERKAARKATEIDTTFELKEVIPKDELTEIEMLENNNSEDIKNIKIDKKFKNSPIISPIFGIERINNTEPNDMELENTANYEKLDSEIQKTNEFLMTLKDLQNNLE